MLRFVHTLFSNDQWQLFPPEMQMASHKRNVIFLLTVFSQPSCSALFFIAYANLIEENPTPVYSKVSKYIVENLVSRVYISEPEHKG